MDGESIRVTRSVSIPRSEIGFRYSRSRGPGGQHAQKTETRVEASFDVESSESLTEAQKKRVIGRAGPVIRAVAQDERSQLAQPRAGDAADRRGAARGASRPPKAPADPPDEEGGRAPAGRETPPEQSQAPAACARSRLEILTPA